MASWMVHLRVADRLLDCLREMDEAAFVMGNIAPDSGVPNADWTQFSPPKAVSHFKEKGTDPAAFCAEYFNREVIPKYSKREYSFFLGYYAHLLTDVEWVNEVVWPLLLAHPAQAAPERNALIAAAKEDWYDLDFLFLEQHPDFRAFKIYENTVGFRNDFMEMFAGDAFENRRAYICSFYHSGEHGDLRRKYRYLTPEQASDFVERTVEKIRGIVE